MKRNLKYTKKIILPIILVCSSANSAAMHAHLPAAAAAGAGADAADKEHLEKGNIDQAFAALKKVYGAHFTSVEAKKNLLAYIKKSTCLYHLAAVRLVVPTQKKVLKDLHEAAQAIEDDAWKEYKKKGGLMLPIKEYSNVMNQFIDVQTKILSQADCIGAINLLTRFQEFIKQDMSRVGEQPAIDEA